MRTANDHQNQSTKCLSVLLDLLIWFATYMLALAPLSIYKRSVSFVFACALAKESQKKDSAYSSFFGGRAGFFSTLAARARI